MKYSRLASLVAVTLFLAQSAHAGRPLSVDDANVNDVGAGHVVGIPEHRDRAFRRT